MQGGQRRFGTDADCGEATLCKVMKAQLFPMGFQPADQKNSAPVMHKPATHTDSSTMRGDTCGKADVRRDSGMGLPAGARVLRTGS
jgi:hypothetical protein